MIDQQINLYQDRFREQRLWLSAAQVATLVAVMVVGIAIWSYLLERGLSEAEQQARLIQADRDRLSTELAAANTELARLLEDDRLDLKITDTARQISARRQVLKFVDSNRFGSGEGFSSYLVALSRLHADGVWLNRIRLAENFVHIAGSSLRAEQVPGYFDRFSGEPVFQGNRFDLFEVSRASETDWKVDFEIATSGGLDE